MAAGVELVGLHLVVAGAAVAGDAADVRRALEHLDVVHDGLVAAGDHRLVLGERGRNSFRHGHADPDVHQVAEKVLGSVCEIQGVLGGLDPETPIFCGGLRFFKLKKAQIQKAKK